MTDPIISVYHDTRRKKAKGVYPIKIRVYHNYKTQFYPLGKKYDLSEEGFKNSYMAEKPRGQNAQLKDGITFLLMKAKKTAECIIPFSFEKFERKFITSANSTTDVFFHYSEVIARLEAEDQVKTASNYEMARKSLKKYLKAKGKDVEKLPFESVNVKFLNDYEKWMLTGTENEKPKSVTTISIYLRTLRTIFKSALAEGDITPEVYPFGKDKYEIPDSENVKKALSKSDLQKLYNYKPEPGSHMGKAKDFWFFSYLANGMNIRDICELKYSNLEKGKFSFIRTKTKRTTKKLKPIVVIITPFIQEIIDKYGNKKTGPNTYVFPIFTHSMTAKEKVRACESFTRFINQHIKKMATLAKVDDDISTYFARHSFSTISVQNGASLEFVQESLGHKNITTTQQYFAGFDEAKKIENANKLLDFNG